MESIGMEIFNFYILINLYVFKCLEKGLFIFEKYLSLWCMSNFVAIISRINTQNFITFHIVLDLITN